MERWQETEGAKYGIAIYNYRGDVSHGLALDIGDAVQIFESCAGWYRGCCLKRKHVKGIFPASFIQLKECVVENSGTPFELVIPREDPTIKEVKTVLREWLELWKELFLKRQETKFYEMKKIMNHLIDIRQKILSRALTHEQMSELKKEITSKIDFWNSQMEMDLVPRINGVAVDVDHTSITELYKIHVESLKEIKHLERQVTMPKSSLSVVKAHRHILLTVKRIVCNLDENIDVFFALFNGETGKYISERFLMRLDKNALPDVAAALSSVKTKTLFTDLGRKSFASDIFIVCQVVRPGGHDNSSKKNDCDDGIRRLYACGVFNVQDNLHVDADYFGDENTFTVPLYLCSNDADLNEIIVRKTSRNSSITVNDGLSIDVSLRIYNGDREKVIKVHPLLIPPDISITRKLGFPEIILPGDTRNDLYLTLERGEFDKGKAKDIEISVNVLMSNGHSLKDCILPGTGSCAIGEYRSIVYYHNNSPKWNETIKLNIPLKDIQDCHVLFTFKYCLPISTMMTTSSGKEKPRKPFAFAFLRPLKPDGTTVMDGTHQLVTYKLSLLDSKHPGKYLSYPSFVSDLSWFENRQTINHSLRSKKHSIFVSTLTCSTKLTQNLDLVGLLKWREHMNKIPDVLKSIVNVPGNEIVKFLQDVLDALFCILDEDNERCGLLVFDSLLFIINLLLNNKYQQFQAVLNTYIKHHFSAALAHRHVVALFHKVMVEKNDILPIRMIANALQFILKIIMQSWALNVRTHPEQSNLDFKRSIKGMFACLNEAMGNTGDGWCNVQSSILSNLPKAYDELSTVFEDEELAEMMENLFCSARPNSLIIEKLNFLDGIITTSPLFHNVDSRVKLMPLLLNTLHHQLSEKNELKTCADLMGNLLSCLDKTTSGSVYNEVEQITKALLQVVLQAVVAVDRSSPRAGSYVAILLTLLKMMTEKHYKSYLNSFGDLKQLRDFLNKAFGVLTNLLKREIYPNDWFVMRIEGSYVILGAIQNFSQSLTEHFLEENMFDYQLWNSYFHLAILFVTHEILNLDKYSEVKKGKIIEKYGDMRHVMGHEVVQMWNALGNLQINFIPSMISPFLEMTLVPEPALRRETLPIFYDMMEKEMLESGNIDRVEENFVNKLDVFLSNHAMGDENYKQLFGEILTEKIAQSTSLLGGRGLAFVHSVMKLLERLLDYRNVISLREEYREMKMSCIVNLMNYYDEIGKEEMYLRYVLKLYKLHIEAENYCEAGFALYLYASRLTFEDWPLKAEENFPAQTEAERKELIYKMAIDLFDKGQLWESGIRLCKKVINLYEKETFEFMKLGEMLKTEAAFYRNIINIYRPEPVYFRVGFYGRTFPFFLQGKQFIYRGRPLETIGEFCFRIQKEYPDAEVLRHNNPLEEEILESNKQYIQCCLVKPVVDVMAVPSNADGRIVSYYEVNWVKKFRLSRPFHVGEIVDSSDEFATLWTEVITLTTEIVLPGILPWIPVVATESTKLNPIENAIKTVESKTAELENITQQLKDDISGNINPLSLILQGVIDANVNGGIANYEKAFFTPEYARTNYQRKIDVLRLEEALHGQASVLRRALILHESRITPALRPLHENLLRRYNEMLCDLPGDTRGLFLIQRKWSISSTTSPSPSIDRRSSTDTNEGDTLSQKFKRLITGNKAVSHTEQIDSTDGIKQSTSLMSLSDRTTNVSQSASVPDLRLIDGQRPKVPRKKGRRSWEDDSGSIFPMPGRRSSVQSYTSKSNNSLTDLDESDELRLAQAVENTDSPPVKQKFDYVSNSTQPDSPRKKSTTSSLPGVTSVKKTPKEIKSHGTPSLFRRKNQRKHSKSLDDLDKIGEESEPALRLARSQDHLDDMENTDETVDDIPPPLLPKTYTLKQSFDDPYDSLDLPLDTVNSGTLGSVNQKSIVYDTVVLPRCDALVRNKKQKHEYTNLDKYTPPMRKDSKPALPFRSRVEAYDVVTSGRPYRPNPIATNINTRYDTVSLKKTRNNNEVEKTFQIAPIDDRESTVPRSRDSDVSEETSSIKKDLNENRPSETPPPLKPKKMKRHESGPASLLEEQKKPPAVFPKPRRPKSGL